MVDAENGRPPGPPRLPDEQRPRIPTEGAIPEDSASMPDVLGYDSVRHRLAIGGGFIENVPPEVWQYEVSGRQVLPQWFSYRKANRGRPIMGDRRPPSLLGTVQPDHWLAEYTTELINLLNVLGRLLELESALSRTLSAICADAHFPVGELRSSGALELASNPAPSPERPRSPNLFD